jgi:hypothetical protein
LDCPGRRSSRHRFQVKRNGTNVGSALDCDGSVDVTVTAGQQYTITEVGAGATDLANYESSFGEGCTGTLANFGDTASCTITNRLKAALQLTVIKHVINDDGGTKVAFHADRQWREPEPCIVPRERVRNGRHAPARGPTP